MANYRAVSSGVWSALARWQDDSTGSFVASTVLPGAADVVYANNFTVTLDIDITVSQLRTTSASNVNAGGLFDYGVGCNTVIANIVSGTSICIRHNLTTSKSLIGNITGGISTSAWGCSNNGTGTLNIIGNITAGSAIYAYGLASRNINVTNVTGNIIAGSAQECWGIDNFSSGIVNVIGSSTGGTSTDCVGIVNRSNGRVFVTKAIASSNNGGLRGESASGITLVREVQNSSNGRQALISLVLLDNFGPYIYTASKENGSSQILIDGTTSFPSQSNVRQGVIYASGALTGTLVVPSPSNVRQGVPTDNTVGTAALTPADFWNYLASSATPGSMGARVAAIPTNPASVESTGAQIASFNT
jgi:hypothetical protein